MCAKKTQRDRNFVKKDEILIERTVAEQDKKEKIDEEDEIKFERAERMFTNAVLKEVKEEIKKDNLVVNNLKKEYFRFFIRILIVLGLAYCAFNFTTIFVMKKTDVSQITGEYVDTSLTTEQAIDTKKTDANKKETETTTISAVEKKEATTTAALKEEYTTLQALNTNESRSSDYKPTSMTGAQVYGKYYVLHLSTYKKLEKAQKDIDYMKAKGYDCYYVVEGKNTFRVILNVIFTSIDDAELYGKNLKSNKVINSYNVKVMENKIESKSK